MAERGKGNGVGVRGGRGETPELARLRQRIDALDRKIVGLLNERAELGREVGREKVAAGRRAVRDAEREREVLLRVTMANTGPIPQADLLAIYRRLIAATRALEARDGTRETRETRD
jgi:chorismate mutase/prephenate dehydratase